MRLNRTPNPLDRNARNGENDNWDIIEGKTREISDKVDNFLNTLSEDAFNKVIEDIRLNWSHKVDNFSDLPSNPEKGDTVAVENDDMIYRYDGSNWIDVIPFTQFSAIAEIDNRLSSQLAETDDEMFKSSLVNHKVGGFKVWWIDDDAQKGVYTKLAPLLREYGIKMSSAVITNRPHGFPITGLPAYDPESSWMPYSHMKELHEEGIVEFIPHSHTHDINYRYTDMTDEEIHDDMSTNVKIMRQLGWNYKDIPYPFGAQDERVRKIARQYYRSGIDIRGGALTTPLDQALFPRLGMDTRDTQEIIAEINKAYENDTLIILMSHVDQYGGLEESKMRAVIEHVQSLGGKFITGEEAITNYGNLLQIGDDSISFDGGIHSNRLGKVRVTKDNEFLASNVPSDFETGITLTKIDQNPMSNTDGFPLNWYGTLVTVKSSDLNNWTHQTFYGGFRNLIAYRHSDSGDTWSDWHVNYMPVGHGALPDNSKPRDYPLGTSTTTIEGSVASDTPNNSGGIMTTIKTKTGSYLWIRQEFYDVTNSELYTRRADNLDNWRGWQKVKQFYNKDVNEINGNTPAADYENGITHGYIRVNSAGLPNGKQSGNLTTYKHSGATGSYQTLRVSGSEELYIRGDSSDGSWRPWKRIVVEDV